jgi:GAF domain-containing protein
MLPRHGQRKLRAMANLKELPDAATGQKIDAVLQQLRNSKDVGADLLQVLDIAIGLTGADMGTLQRFDECADCLKIVASRGFSTEALAFFGVVLRDTNTTCAVALTRRMRVFVEDVSTSYLYVGTRELDMLRAGGIAAVQSTPFISSNGRLWGVFSTHFREPQRESEFDHAPLDRLAVQVADSLEQREGLVPSQRFHGKQVPEDSQTGC